MSRRIDPKIQAILASGVVIPAHPLALNSERRFDERRQRALTRYYCEAGAGGVAVGVHTTQFAIRDPKVGHFEPVLTLAVETIRECEQKLGKPMVKIAGICGDTPQAVREAELASRLGYEIGLVSLASMRDATTDRLIAHCLAVAEILPVMGFYLQSAAGGRALDFCFWQRFFEIENAVAVKVAPFNRYHTLDVLRALAATGREAEIALYTGNDDNIVADLLTEFRIREQGRTVTLRFSGGLLGHWAVWTKRAVELLADIQRCWRHPEWTRQVLARSAEITSANAALFDARNNFAGCIAGLNEILRRQGFLEGRWCLDPSDDLSPGQIKEVECIYRNYPHLNDDEFVSQNIVRWLS
jgi:dihydrodipicolinate synthase/N-acetylneuraminate lyase